MRPDVLAAQRALRKLATVRGGVGVVGLRGRSFNVHILSPLLGRPRSRTGLKWVSDAGYYRKMWVLERETGKRRVYYLYYGPWGPPKHARSAYLVIFHGGGPALEVRLSQPRPPEGQEVPIEHVLAFRGASYRDPSAMHRTALRRVERAKIEVAGDSAQIGKYLVSSGQLLPSPKRVLLNAIACSLVALDVRAAARGEKESGTDLPAKKKRFKWKKGQMIKILLDSKFESQNLHEKLIEEVRSELRAKGIAAEPKHPYDLVARKGRRWILVEMKAWRKGGAVPAAQAAAGQLLYYSQMFREQYGYRLHLILALWKGPHPDDLRFVRSAGIGVIWPSGHEWSGDRLARRVLPELIAVK